MATLEWSNEYSIGVPAMDADHRDLLDMCNRYLEAVYGRENLEHLISLLDRIILRTQAHFQAEERMLDRHGYPGLAIHKAEHDRLLRDAEALSYRMRTDQGETGLEGIVRETTTFLGSWLLEHIRHNDRPYQPFLRSLI